MKNSAVANENKIQNENGSQPFGILCANTELPKNVFLFYLFLFKLVI